MTTTTVAPPAFKWFTALTGVTSLGIFVEALLAGQFVSQDHRDSWIDIHGTVANVVVLASLAAAVVALITLRRTFPRLTWGSVVLFVLLVIQTIIGHLITDASIDGLIGVHVPLVLVIFGLTVSLSITATAARRKLTTT
jgi:lipopolysaccharide export LptBFGC system permease protein LptF